MLNVPVSNDNDKNYYNFLYLYEINELNCKIAVTNY